MVSSNVCVCVCVSVLASDRADGEGGVHVGDKGGVTSVSSLAFVFVYVCVRVSLGMVATVRAINTNTVISKLGQTHYYSELMD